MKPPENESGPAGHHPGETATQKIAATAKQQHDESSAPSGLVVVNGTELLPIGGAQYSRVTVSHSDCGHVHSHIKFEVNAISIVRAPACAKHTEYRIRIVDVVPSAAQRRIRGAA